MSWSLKKPVPKREERKMQKTETDRPLQWQEGEYTVYRNYQWTAPGCHNMCGQLVYVKDGKVVKVEGDPQDPYSKGRCCARCLNLPEAMYSEKRVTHPLKRVGKRGEGKWEKITWDEAYDIIEEKVRGIWKDYGAESIVCFQGTGRNIVWQTPFLAFTAFKTPNFALGFLSGDSCMLPRNTAQTYVLGDPTIVDMGVQFEDGMDNPDWKPQECLVIWGNNPLVSNGDGFIGHWIIDVMKMGTQLIVIDPELTWLAAHSKIWLPIRPGTDGPLAMAMLNVIIQEDLYDHEFVENWCYGFEQLAQRVSEWTPKRAAEVCWVDEDKIVEAARFYANAKPAAVQWGLAIDMHPHGVPTAHAISALTAITGNLDVPGGNIIMREAYNIYCGYRTGYETLPQEVRDKIITQDAGDTETLVAGSASGDKILEAIETDDPYPIKMLFFQTTNPIANMGAEAPRVYDAIMKVPFNVCMDYVITPTAAICDLFLPCAFGHERNSMRTWWTPFRISREVTTYEDCRSDERVIVEIGRRLDPELFDKMGIHDDKTLCTWVMHNTKLPDSCWPEEYEGDFEDIESTLYSYCTWPYKKYEKGLLRNGEVGFATPSGRVELYSLVFKSSGCDPLPNWEEAPESPYSTPELYKEYPFVLTTGQRSWVYFHSENRQLPTMREIHPDPRVTINSKVAKEMGLVEGDWVWVENIRGRCRQRVQLSDFLDERVVRGEHGWWFPEEKEDELFRTFDSNINNLTTQGVVGKTGYGAPYKCLLCKIYKCTPENSTQLPTDRVIEVGGNNYEKQFAK